jgi:hypothetical protein
LLRRDVIEIYKLIVDDTCILVNEWVDLNGKTEGVLGSAALRFIRRNFRRMLHFGISLLFEDLFGWK